MSAAHTAGPWLEVEPGHIRTQSLALVAVVQHGLNAKADVRLIAAAPDLLEALKSCLQCFDEMKGRKPAFVEDAIAMGNEAIAKATGGTQ